MTPRSLMIAVAPACTSNDTVCVQDMHDDTGGVCVLYGPIVAGDWLAQHSCRDDSRS